MAKLQPLPDSRKAKVDLLAAVDAKLNRIKAKDPAAIRRAFQARYAHDAPSFARDCFKFLPGEKPAEYQLKALETLMDKKRLAVRALHGTGKSTLASWVVIWGLFTADDVKAITTAGVWRQLEKYLWPEIHKWIGRFKWDMAGIDRIDDSLNLMGIRLSATAEAFAVASDNHAFIEGAHAKRIVYVFDESKAVPAPTFDAAEGAFSGGTTCEAYALSLSTPGEPAGRFYDICSRKRGYEDWAVMHVALTDAIEAGRTTQAWADQRKAQWGESSPMYQNRVLGNFATSETNGLIPLAWVEAANERWLAWKDSGALPGPLEQAGVDVARSGDDKTVIAPRYGKIISGICEYEKRDTMETTGNVVALLGKTGARAVVDVIGVGAGVVDRLKEQNYSVHGFNAGSGTEVTDRSGELHFVNARSGSWWMMRELLDPTNKENIMLPPHDSLTGDLTAPTWTMTSTGKIKVESKDEIKKRIGRSTDYADAVIMAFWKGDIRGTISEADAERIIIGTREGYVDFDVMDL